MVSAGTAASGAPDPFVVRWSFAFGFGANECGELGNGSTSSATSPVRVGLPGTVQQVGAGGFFGAALLSDGTVWAWGNNENGQLGSATGACASTPQHVQGLLRGGSPRSP
jgi:alpha-tubulin suppressor-like RCC1 family protein